MNIVERIKLTSFENTSILRKMTIFYFLMSILPLGVLYYFYLEIREKGQLQITEESFAMTLFLVVIGVTIGYFAMRSLIQRVIDITKRNATALQEILGPEVLDSLMNDENNEISILARSFHEITSHLEQNVRSLQEAKKTLHSVLARVGDGISTMENIDSFLNLIIQTVTEALMCESGFLFLIDEKKNEFYVKQQFGKNGRQTRSLRIPGDDPMIQAALEERKAVILRKSPEQEELRSLFAVPMILAPLALHDDVSGLLLVCGIQEDKEIQEEELTLLNNLALQTAVALENSKLNDDAERTYFETISALALAVEAKDPYSRGHSESVAKYAVEMAKKLDLSPDDINTLRDAAKLHDIGKIGITDDILKKAGPLNEQETELMKKHVEIGEGIIRPIRSLQNLCDVVRHHHEKLDGTGYPDGLKGEDISVLARILAVADIFDALTSNRPYREPFSPGKALEQLRSMKNAIDQKVVDVLSEVVL